MPRPAKWPASAKRRARPGRFSPRTGPDDGGARGEGRSHFFVELRAEPTRPRWIPEATMGEDAARLAARLVCFGFDGYTPDARPRDDCKGLRGGHHLRPKHQVAHAGGDAVRGPQEARGAQAAARHDRPEGGRVRRFRPPQFSDIPAAAAIQVRSARNEHDDARLTTPTHPNRGACSTPSKPRGPPAASSRKSIIFSLEDQIRH